jgi:hypothetical protein
VLQVDGALVLHAPQLPAGESPRVAYHVCELSGPVVTVAVMVTPHPVPDAQTGRKPAGDTLFASDWSGKLARHREGEAAVRGRLAGRRQHFADRVGTLSGQAQAGQGGVDRDRGIAPVQVALASLRKALSTRSWVITRMAAATATALPIAARSTGVPIISVLAPPTR